MSGLIPVPIAVPLIMGIGNSGPQPTPPETLRTLVQQAIAAVVPDYTANLPGTLIEDVLSTIMAAVVTMDQARVDAVNSISPAAASSYVIAQLGQAEGLPQGTPTNTSVNVVFSGTIGYVIPAGFIVSDGTYQYVVQNGTVIGSNGQSAQTYCVATESGSWTPLANTVTTVVTTIPRGYTVTVNNPQDGTPANGTETVQSYRSRVLAAMSKVGLGTVNFIQTLLMAIPGVSPRLVRIRQTQSSWEIICGGGDPYAVANAIFIGTLHFPMLMGSMVADRNVNVTLINPPDTYQVTYVNPPSQTLTMDIVWNTSLTNFTASSQVNQLGQAAVTNYINGIPVGQSLNLLAVYDVFKDAISSVLPRHLLSSFVTTVYINGTEVSPEAGTSLIASDPESYFSVSATGISVVQG